MQHTIIHSLITVLCLFNVLVSSTNEADKFNTERPANHVYSYNEIPLVLERNYFMWTFWEKNHREVQLENMLTIYKKWVIDNGSNLKVLHTVKALQDEYDCMAKPIGMTDYQKFAVRIQSSGKLLPTKSKLNQAD
jgi:hypothetical protein